MKFWEAMKAMEEGKKVTHESFNMFNFGYLYLNKETEHITTSKGQPFDINSMDAINDKWNLYDNRKELHKEYKVFKDLYDFLKGSCAERLCRDCPLNNYDGNERWMCYDTLNFIDVMNEKFKLDK